MNFEYYLDKFKNAAKLVDKSRFDKTELEISVGIVLDSVYLKLFKRTWTNDLINPLNAEARIFFSIWVNDKNIKSEQSIL